MALMLKNGDVVVSGSAIYRNGEYAQTALDKLIEQRKQMQNKK